MKYCDGLSFSGAADEPHTGLYFRGAAIRRAMQAELLSRGLDQATEAVISGCSAGGLATILHVDEWCDAMPAGSKCVGMPDSGFFDEFQDPRAKPLPPAETAAAIHNSAPLVGASSRTTNPGDLEDGLKWAFAAQNASAGLSARCLAAQGPGDQSNCIFAQHAAPLVRSPLVRRHMHHVITCITLACACSVSQTLSSKNIADDDV